MNVLIHKIQKYKVCDLQRNLKTGKQATSGCAPGVCHRVHCVHIPAHAPGRCSGWCLQLDIIFVIVLLNIHSLSFTVIIDPFSWRRTWYRYDTSKTPNFPWKSNVFYWGKSFQEENVFFCEIHEFLIFTEIHF